MKSFVFIITFSLYFLSLETGLAAGGFVPCTGLDCGSCELVQMANTIITWLIGILFLVFAVIMTVAGYGLVTSGGNQAALAAAKDKFKNALIGIIIVLAAWLIVDTLLKAILPGGNTSFGPWNRVECTRQAETISPYPEAYAAVSGRFTFIMYTYDVAGSCKRVVNGNENDLATCELAAAAVASAPSDSYTEKRCDDAPVSTASFPAWSSEPVCGASASPSADGVFDFNPGIAAQMVHASPQLSAMVNCMANIVPGNVGRISSISDGWLINGTRTWEDCWAGRCQHSAGSAHYGRGGRCGRQSFAVDFGDEENFNILCPAARSCGASYCNVHGGNHIHAHLDC